MLVLFFLLGYSLGLLAAPAIRALATHAAKISKALLWWAAAALWLAVAAFGVFVLYAEYHDHWNLQLVLGAKLFEYAYAKPTLALLLGLAVYSWRGRIVSVCKRLIDAPPQVLQHPWVATVAGIGASVVVAVAILALISPETLFRLQSVKVGEVEAKFAAATEQTLRTYSDVRLQDTNTILGRWSEIGARLKTTIQPLQDLLANPAGRQLRQDRHRKAADFLDKVARPLATAMACFTNEFRVRETNVQHRAVILANNWAHLVIELVRAPKMRAQNESSARGIDATIHIPAIESPEQTIIRLAHDAAAIPDDTADELRAWKFVGYVAESDELIETIDRILRDKDSGCDWGSKRAWQHPPIPDYAPRDLRLYSLNDLKEIFSDGYVLSFVADLLSLTHGFDRAASLMTQVNDDGFIAIGPDDMPAELYFYFRLASAKYNSSWQPRTAKYDLDGALGIANKLIAAISESSLSNKKEILTYYQSFRAGILNNRIYYPVGEWLEGHPVDVDDIPALQEAAAELKKWVDKQSLIELRGQDATSRLSIMLLPSALDTLATYEIMMGETRKDRCKERCERIDVDLIRSLEMLDDLLALKKIDPSSYRVTTRVRAAHRSIYRSICSG